MNSEHLEITLQQPHVHLTKRMVWKLFGETAKLSAAAPTDMPGKFIASQRVTVTGPSGASVELPITGPSSPRNQVELSPALAFKRIPGLYGAGRGCQGGTVWFRNGGRRDLGGAGRHRRAGSRSADSAAAYPYAAGGCFDPVAAGGADYHPRHGGWAAAGQCGGAGISPVRQPHPSAGRGGLPFPRR